jgi:hypothetical protein
MGRIAAALDLHDEFHRGGFRTAQMPSTGRRSSRRRRPRR